MELLCSVFTCCYTTMSPAMAPSVCPITTKLSTKDSSCQSPSTSSKHLSVFLRNMHEPYAIASVLLKLMCTVLLQPLGHIRLFHFVASICNLLSLLCGGSTKMPKKVCYGPCNSFPFSVHACTSRDLMEGSQCKPEFTYT